METTQTFNLRVIAYQSEQESSPYATLLPLALKFYEAQRATGPFPTVSWRRVGGENDGDDVGRDLSGGWFDAGDHVKFNLPMSYSVTMLNWGLIAFESAYRKSGVKVYAQEQVKYALDYLLAAYNDGADALNPSDDIVYYQVGDGDLDHSFWGPPEDMSMNRPTFSCDSTHRCSEVAGAMAAAMASGSIALRDYDSSYADQLLETSKKLYSFAVSYQGNNGYTAANSFYPSFSGYNDELSWAAIWLYISTNESQYLADAKSYVAKSGDAIYWSQNWDNVSNGTLLLLATITEESSYQESINNHFNYWLHNISYSSGGLAFLSEWGSLRYSSTTAFMALLYAQKLPMGEQRSDLISFAKGQIDYILGDNPRNSSYVVGYGNNPPINPHHRAAHNSPTYNIQSPINNEFILEGALVGGPKSTNDMDYADNREDHVANEVATDYNAGFTGALAGLIELVE
jgi:endoglucanase